jgi:hypothetical protein
MFAKPIFLLPVYVLISIFTSPAVAAEVQDIAWNGDNIASHTFVILPGKFAELCGKVTAGEEIAWKFDATQSTDFNIHYHSGNTVIEPVSINKIAQTSGNIAASETQDYCWMWANTSKDKPARLEVSLERRVP